MIFPSLQHMVQRWNNCSWLRAASAEYFGCMIFHFIGSVSPTPIANAVALTTMVYFTANVSGGHLNPALTLTFCMLGYTQPSQLVVYWVAQTLGCISGALWITALMPRDESDLVGCIHANPDISALQVMGWEALATMFFIVPVMSVVWHTQHKSGYGNTGPIMVGIALYSVALATGDWTGAKVNPARTLASELIFACKESHMIRYFVAGQIIGAVTAPLAVIPWYGVADHAWYRRVTEAAEPEVISKAPESCAIDTFTEISLVDDVVIVVGPEGR